MLSSVNGFAKIRKKLDICFFLMSSLLWRGVLVGEVVEPDDEIDD